MFVLFAGILLLGLGYVVYGAYYYLLITTQPSFPTYVHLEIWEAIVYFLTALGAILVAFGWGLDRRASGDGPPTPVGGRARTAALVGIGLVGVGAGLFAGATAFFGAVFASASVGSPYFQGLPEGTIAFLEIAMGVGVIVAACGWLLHRWAELARSGPAVDAP
jgi:hypothetical protein